jgi:hypothetical protein
LGLGLKLQEKLQGPLFLIGLGIFDNMVFCTFTQIIMSNQAPEGTQRLNVDLPKSQYFALKSYALHNETTVSQLVRDSLKSIVEYDTWFKAYCP